MASRPSMPVDPDAGIPDLIRRLTDDSKRLALDEVRLAKLELKDNIRTAAKGAIWLGVAFGAGIVALVAATIFLSALLGRLLGNYWAGTLVVAVIELGAAYFLVRRGLDAVKEPAMDFPETRAAARETAEWVRTVREPEVEQQRPLTDGNGRTVIPVERIPGRAD